MTSRGGPQMYSYGICRLNRKALFASCIRGQIGYWRRRRSILWISMDAIDNVDDDDWGEPTNVCKWLGYARARVSWYHQSAIKSNNRSGRNGKFWWKLLFLFQDLCNHGCEEILSEKWYSNGGRTFYFIQELEEDNWSFISFPRGAISQPCHCGYIGRVPRPVLQRTFHLSKSLLPLVKSISEFSGQYTSGAPLTWPIVFLTTILLCSCPKA